jgi:hypothetical protein
MKSDISPYVKFYVDPNALLGEMKEKMPRSDILKLSAGTARSVAASRLGGSLLPAEEGPIITEWKSVQLLDTADAVEAPGAPPFAPPLSPAAKSRKLKEEKKQKERVERSWSWSGNQLPHLHLAVERAEQLAVVEAHLLLAMFAKNANGSDSLIGQCVLPLAQIAQNAIEPKMRRGSGASMQAQRASSMTGQPGRGLHKFDEALVINGRVCGRLQCTAQVVWPGDEEEVSRYSDRAGCAIDTAIVLAVLIGLSNSTSVPAIALVFLYLQARQWLKKSTNVLDFRNAFSLFRIICNQYNCDVACQSGKELVTQLVSYEWVKDRKQAVEVLSELLRHRLIELASGKQGKFKDSKDSSYKFEEHTGDTQSREGARSRTGTLAKVTGGLSTRFRSASEAAKDMLRTASSGNLKLAKNGSPRGRGVTVSKSQHFNVR